MYFCGVGCNFSSFIYDFTDLGPIFFFPLMSLAKGLSILFVFSENELLVSLIFSIVFLVSVTLFLLIFMISFPLVTLDFICFLFLVPLGIRLDCFFEIFLIY